MNAGKGDDFDTIALGVIPRRSRHSTTPETRMRWPAMRAFPPQTSGVLLIRPLPGLPIC